MICEETGLCSTSRKFFPPQTETLSRTVTSASSFLRTVSDIVQNEGMTMPQKFAATAFSGVLHATGAMSRADFVGPTQSNSGYPISTVQSGFAFGGGGRGTTY